MEQNILLNNRYIVQFNIKLGSGSYGTVYETEDLNNPAIKLATKQVRACNVKANEIELWMQIKGLYVVELIYWELINDVYYFVMEKCNEGSLGDLIKKKGILAEDLVIKFARLIIDGYYYSLYQKNIVHRDLKPDNIVIQNGLPKIVDFGVVRTMESQIPVEFSQIGTPLYCPPEIITQKKCNFKYDVYSIGCIIYCCLYGIAPKNPTELNSLINFHKLLENNQKEAIQFPPRKINSQMKEVNAKLQDLITSMIVHEPDKRLDMEQLRKHPVFQQNQNLLTKVNFTRDLTRMQKILNTFVTELNQFDGPSLEKISIPQITNQTKAIMNQEIIDKYFLFTTNSTTFAIIVLNQIVQNFSGIDQINHVDYIVLLFMRLINLSFDYIVFTLKESCTQIPESLIQLKTAYRKYKISNRCRDTKTLIEKKEQEWYILRNQLLKELTENWRDHTDEQLFKSISTAQIQQFLDDELKRTTIAVGFKQNEKETISQNFQDVDSTYKLIQQTLVEYKKKFDSSFQSGQVNKAGGLFLLLNFISKKRPFNNQFETFNFSDIYNAISKNGDDLIKVNQLLLKEFEEEQIQ